MPSLILTDETVRTLKAGSKRQDYCDSSEGVPFSFGVRVGKKGKSWWTRYTLYGVRRRFDLGYFPQVKRDDALWEAFEVHQKVRQGHDPQLKRQSQRDAKTVGYAAEVYLNEIEGVLAPRTCKIYRDILEGDVLPAWRKRALNSLTRGEIRGLLRSIRDRGAGSVTTLALAVLSNLFKLAEAEDWGEGNPCLGLPRVWKPRRRTDSFTPDEIHRIWNHMDGLDSVIADAWKVLLLTGQRPGEVQNMKYQDLDRSWWKLPMTKNGRPHVVYLAEPALQIIHEERGYADRERDAVFPSVDRPERGFTDWGGFGRRARAKLGIPHLRPHTARHTFITWLRSRDVDMYMVKTLVNHTVGNDVTAGYDHYRYLPQRKKWFTRYAEYILKCARGEFERDHDQLLAA